LQWISTHLSMSSMHLAAWMWHCLMRK
jgi:lytR_cpsA_psr: cell envelope-related function transcriptional attenuator common domain